MNKRGVAFLFVLTLLTAFLALYQDTRYESRLTQEHSAALTTEREFGALDTALASALVTANGFSQRTILPAWAAARCGDAAWP